MKNKVVTIAMALPSVVFGAETVSGALVPTVSIQFSPMFAILNFRATAPAAFKN
jgi:hypothetical protein